MFTKLHIEKFVTETFKQQQPKFSGDALTVDRIEWCHNDKLKKDFNEHLNDSACSIKLLFHGTPIGNINSICANGFEIEHDGMLGHIGKGSYFGEYVGQSLYYQLKYKYHGIETQFQLLLCAVNTGDCREVKRCYSSEQTQIRSGDSHKTKACEGGYEYCIFKSASILPICILHMSREVVSKEFFKRCVKNPTLKVMMRNALGKNKRKRKISLKNL
jgi:hypothetical protein